MSDINYILSTLSERQQIAQTVSNSQSEKLATIEEGATADQTADEIRALSIHSVMGESSRADGATQYAAGLVLAGNSTHGNEFLRKDGTWAAAGSSIIEPFNASSATSLPFNSQTYSLVEIEQPIQTVVHSTTHQMLKTASANQWNSLVSSDGAARMSTSINVRSAHSKVRLVTSLSARIDRVMVGLRFVRTIDGTDTVVAGSEQFGRSSGSGADDDHHTYTVECVDVALPAALAANSSRVYPFTVNYQVQMTWNHPTSETGYVEFNWNPGAGTGSNNSSIIMSELHPVCAIVRN